MSSATNNKAQQPKPKQTPKAKAKQVEAFDAIVIGAGHNGLTAAATLARKGKRGSKAGDKKRKTDSTPGSAKKARVA